MVGYALQVTGTALEKLAILLLDLSRSLQIALYLSGPLDNQHRRYVSSITVIVWNYVQETHKYDNRETSPTDDRE